MNWTAFRILLSYSMQACYVNTTHPDFLNGHKAMAIVNDRMNANKPPEKGIDPKTGKLAPGTLNNGKDLDTDPKKDDASFFGSFFAKDKAPRRKGGPVMEAVRLSSGLFASCFQDALLAPFLPAKKLISCFRLT